MHLPIWAAIQHSTGMVACGVLRRSVPLTPLNLDLHSVTSQAMLNSAGDVVVPRTKAPRILPEKLEEVGAKPIIEERKTNMLVRERGVLQY